MATACIVCFMKCLCSLVLRSTTRVELRVAPTTTATTTVLGLGFTPLPSVPHPYSDMSVSVSVGGVHGTAASSLHDTSSLLLHLRPGTISEAVGNVRVSRLHQCVQIIKASDFGSRCSDKRYIGWVGSICRHQHDKDAVAAALCDIATQSISSGGSMDPHRCARVLKVIEDFTDKGNWIMDSPIILLQRCIRPGDFSSGMVHLTQSLLPFLHANTDAFISKKEVKLCQATFYKFATLLPCYIEYKDTSTVPTQDLATQCESLLTKFWDKSRPWIAAIGRDLIRVLLPISKCQGVSEIWYMLTSGDNTGRRLAKVCSLSTPYWLHRHLISPTEEEELSSLFTAFIAGDDEPPSTARSHHLPVSSRLRAFYCATTLFTLRGLCCAVIYITLIQRLVVIV
ncbi:Integrator complex subunit 3 [Perkinsus olseni]|uniref:Integrator complex subunit 3 n=1 Tax=Perkinsus olseni TaxID=32597 RepID=A0A7J6TBK2_PEROL|nr:Integrator complex subunit 3 [Perkinsus olseni]